MWTPIALLSMTGLLAAMAIAAGAAIDDKKATEIVTKAGCVICHSVDKKMVGPSYVEVARKRKADKNAVTVMSGKIRAGGTGAYGQIPMPPNRVAMISDADVKAIVEWILTK